MLWEGRTKLAHRWLRSVHQWQTRSVSPILMSQGDFLACRSSQPFVKEMLEIWEKFRDSSRHHLEHRVVQRLLGRFLVQGFMPGETPGIVKPDVEAPRAIESTEHQRPPFSA
jgi:hypothetical protein